MRTALLISFLLGTQAACTEPGPSSHDTDLQGDMHASPGDIQDLDTVLDATGSIDSSGNPNEEDVVAIEDSVKPLDVEPTEDIPPSPVDAGEPDANQDQDAALMPDAAPDDTADDDGDGLPNSQEAMMGTDPANPDTDGDGYLDGHEVAEGVDPLDPSSRIYHGNWPYNPDKDQIESPGWEKCLDGECIGFGSCNPADKDDDASDWQDPTGCSLKNGLKLPRWTAKDQYGDLVDIYDFIGTGKPIVLDVATPYCKPCKALAAYFATGDPNHTTVHSPEPLTSYAWWKPEYEVLLEMINNDEIHWITVIWSSCVSGNPVDENAGKAWHDEWPHDKIPALVDPDCQLKDYLNVKAMPHIDVLDSQLVFTTYATNGPVAGIKALLEL